MTAAGPLGGRPGRLSGVAALIAAILVVVLVGTGAVPTLLGALGVVAVAAGLVSSRSRVLAVGVLAGFGAILLGGVAGIDAPSAVAAGVASVLAWTAGSTSIELRDEIGRTGTLRLEATHVAGTTVLVGGVGAVVLAATIVPVDASPVGLALVVFGALCIAAGLALE